MTPPVDDVRHTPVLPAHEELGAKFTEFSGWLLPLRYPQGTTKEHLATRRAVGIFDVSHLGRVSVEGEGAFALLQYAFTNDLSKIAPGRAQYTLLLNEEGGVVDDLVVCWDAPQRFVVVPNAANTAEVAGVLEDLRDEGSFEATIADTTAATGMIAVQGPLWEGVCRASGLSDLPSRFGVVRCGDAMVAGTGYTGERGVEVVVPADRACEMFLQLVRAAVELGGTAAGLGARDTLRLEMGYPLWGNEMDDSFSPYEAGLGWVVAETDDDFRGRPAALARKAAPRWELFGVVMNDAGAIPRAGYAVRAGDVLGTVTSGGFSPLLQLGIALARMPAGLVRNGSPVGMDIRGRTAGGVLTDPPFVETSLK